jgi:predicted nucleotidyltransferase/DNA-binding XRE family transcriptional regulator
MTVVALDQLVRQLRERAGLTQAQLAKRAGISQPAISDYEHGRKRPRLSTLQRLAAAVDLEVDLRCVPASSAPTLASLRRDRRAIVEICRRHGASNPRVFGSVLTGLADDDSDIDLLVDLEAGRTLFDVAALHDDLVELLHREVDVVTAGAVRGRLAHLAFDAQPL